MEKMAKKQKANEESKRQSLILLLNLTIHG